MKRLLAPMMIFILLVMAQPARAQVADIASGINLGFGLLRIAAARRRQQQQMSSGYGNTYYGGSLAGAGVIGGGSSAFPLPSGTSVGRTDAEENKARAISSYNKGIKAFNHENYESSIKYFQQTLQLNPAMKMVHGELGCAYEKTGDYEQAQAELQIELKNGTGNKNICFTAASVALKLQNYERANDLFRRYLKHEPSGEQAEYARTITEILEKDYFYPAAGDYFADASRGQLRRWSNVGQPLKVYIEENSSLKGYRAEFPELLKDSFSEWAKGSAGKLQFEFTNNESEAQIRCAWTDDRSTLGSSSELGVTRTTSKEDGIILSANICLYTFGDDPNQSSQHILRTAKNVDLHEIGHSLGLEHSQHVYDIMYPTVFPDGLAFPLSARDTNTLVAVYSDSVDPKILPGTFCLTSKEAVNLSKGEHVHLSRQE